MLRPKLLWTMLRLHLPLLRKAKARAKSHEHRLLTLPRKCATHGAIKEHAPEEMLACIPTLTPAEKTHDRRMLSRRQKALEKAAEKDDPNPHLVVEAKERAMPFARSS